MSESTRAAGQRQTTFDGEPYVSRFAQREQARREERIALYDRIAEHRERSQNAFYASEVRRIARGLVPTEGRVLEVGCGLGDLVASLPATDRVGVDVSPRMIAKARARHPEIDFHVCDVEADPLPDGPFDYIVMSDTVGLLGDIETALERLRPLLSDDGRLIVTYYNMVWEPALRLAELTGVKTRWPDQNWLSLKDIENLLYLADFETVRRGTEVLMPAPIPGASLLNRVGASLPLVREGALVDYFVARAAPTPEVTERPAVSVICPCWNERGNIREAVARTPLMGEATELLFVDGNSTDGTPEEIEQVIREYDGPLELRWTSQDGKGKGDAVRKGFAMAKHPVLMILDSDLTVPPEDLPKFYRALITGKGEFINGVRLVYPLEGEAMRFLNLLGNKAFSVALSWLLEQPIKDSLCGTKVLFRQDYDRIADNRAYFGDFDPFGDFDLLFGAARLNMKIVDLPIRYRARTYGDTKISRFRHGWLLAQMTAFGFRKLRLGL